MMTWNLERLRQLISDNVEESLSLEYKAAEALGKSDAKKAEIVKDVSAFANSSGGVLIYGIAEFQQRDQRHRPERIDPVDRQRFSKEWLEQIIQSIQPRIEGIVIEPDRQKKPLTADGTKQRATPVACRLRPRNIDGDKARGLTPSYKRS